jgi:hypothetical protein
MRTFASFLAIAAACGSPDARHLPDAAAPDAAISPCTMPTGAGTMHTGSINAAETWTAAGSPHVLPGDLGIHAQVTIEPCAVVQIAGGATVTVGLGGELDATGATTKPVLIERLDPAAAWDWIRVIGGDMTLCKETYPSDTSGACPTPVPCP